MRRQVLRIAVGLCAFVLSACANLNFVHDPQFGFIDRQQIPGFLQSIRCELITYYESNRKRRDLPKKHPALAVLDYPYYDLDEKQYGLIGLDLKVQDQLTAGGTFNRVHTGDSAHSRSWQFGPSLESQGTYDHLWQFLIAQDAKLTRRVRDTKSKLTHTIPDPLCFSEIPGLDDRDPNSGDFEQLARGQYPELAQFKRILVNGTIPLAAWLLDNNDEMWTNLNTPWQIANGKEKIVPAQMTYTFTLQVTGTLDAKFTLMSPKWSPLQPDLNGQVQQTSQVTLLLNSNNAAGVSQAPLGAACIYGAKDGSCLPPGITKAKVKLKPLYPFMFIQPRPFGQIR